METVVLIIHLFLALGLIGVVLMQRSEGGGLGMGGGGGGGGLMTGRSAATALGKATWILAVAFIITSLSLSYIAALESRGSSVLDRVGDTDTAAPAPVDSGLDSGLVPVLPTDDGDALVPEVDALVPEADPIAPDAPASE